MINSRSSTETKWIHSFAVTDVCLHPKKFTVYKITSVVFPIDIPEALTCLTVWKRFNDIKALLKAMKKRHKNDHLSGTVPTLNNHTFFKRFEADVITERKLFVIRLLDFIGQHPALYKSQIFQDFLTTTQSMPSDDSLQFVIDEISSEDTIDGSMNTILGRSETSGSSTSISMAASMTSSSMSTPIIDSPQDLNSDASDTMENDLCINASSRKGSQSNNTIESLGSCLSNPIETPLQSSQRQDLKKFKVIDVKCSVMHVMDVKTKQPFIIKSIDRIFDDEDFYLYLPTNFPFMVSLVAYYISETSIYLLLEQATGGRLYDYIRSYSRHSTSAASKTTDRFLSFQLNKVLTLKHRYRSSAIEIPEPDASHPNSPSKSNIKHVTANDDDENTSFSDLLHSYYGNAALDKNDIPDKALQSFDRSESPYEEAPHFNIIANDLDVNNLLNCSQKLLKSVTSTLKRVQNTNDSRLLSNGIIDKYDSGSIESLTHSNDECHEEYMNEMAILKANTYKDTNLLTEHQKDIQSEHLDVDRLPRAIIKRWFREIIFAVKHLHANGVLCYDLHPNNLLLGKSGEILLTYFYRRDFKPYYFDENMQLQCYSSIYIAPERPLTSQSDVWSIGVIFYELLTGYSFRLCHPESTSTYFDIQYPDDVELDSYSQDLIEKMLEVDAEQRIRLDEIEEHPFFICI